MKRKRPTQYLRAWREFRGLTQEQAAERAECSKSTVSRLEDGSVPYSQGKLEALAHAYGCDPVDLLSPPPNLVATEATSELAAYIMSIDRRDHARLLKVIKAVLSADKDEAAA
jgi:transcriptional regulator with XRE-family HTH domain